MAPWLERVLTIVAAVFACSGFWAFLQARLDKKSSKTKMILGLGHDRIVSLSMQYIDRGWISQDEYEDLHDYLYTPYVGMGGNGTAKRLMAEVDKLNVKKINYVQQVKMNKNQPVTSVEKTIVP